jgi:hypothetical protein
MAEGDGSMNVDLLVALVTLAGTLIVLIWNFIDRSQSAFDDRMSEATQLLTGHTQRRSAGIAIIEGATSRLGRRRTWRAAMVGLLCAQAVYLLEWSEQGKRPDEMLNLKRIISLLIDFKDKSPGKVEIADVGRRIKDDICSDQERTRGLNRGEIKKMVDGSRVISDWVKQAS